MAKRKSKPTAPHSSPHLSTPAPHITDIVTDESNESGASASGLDNTQGAYLSPCIFRLYFGKCGNEDTCKFSHSIKCIDPRTASPPAIASPASDAFPRSPRSNAFRAPCKLFMRGYCRNGFNCKFLHERSAPLSPNRTDFKGAGRGSNSQFNKSRQTEQPRTGRIGAAPVAPSFEQSSAFVEEIKDEDIQEETAKIVVDDVGGQSSPPHSTGHSSTESHTPFGKDKSSNDERLPLTTDSALNGPLNFGLPPEADGQDYDFSSHGSDKGRERTAAVSDDSIGNKSAVDEDDDSGEDTWGWQETPTKNKVKAEDVWGDEDDKRDGSLKKVEERAIPERWDDSDDDASHQNTSEGVYRGEPDDIEGEGVGVQDGELEYTSNEGEDAEELEYGQNNHVPEEDENVGEERQSAIEDGIHSPDPYTVEEKMEEEVEAEESEVKVTSQSYSPPKQNDPPALSIEDGEGRASAPPPSQIQPPPEADQVANGIVTPDVPSQTTAPSQGPEVLVLTLHWSRFADPAVDPGLAFCKAFAQNKCSNAVSRSCKFRHSITPREYMLLFKDTQPLLISLEKQRIHNDSSQNVIPITSPSITLHWSHFADPTCDPNMAFCKSFAEMLCTPDKVCGFRHCLTLDEYTLLFKDAQPNLIATTGGTSQQQHATSPTNVTSQQPQTQSSKRPCAFFVKGTCRNGEKCPYYHDTVSVQCPNIRSLGYCDNNGCSYCSTDKQHSFNDKPLPAPSAKPCQYWPNGTCRNGDACAFKHIGAAVRNDRNENGDQVFGNVEEPSGNNQGGDGWVYNNDAAPGDENQSPGDNENKDQEGGNTEEDEWDQGWAHGNVNDAGGWDTANNATGGWDDPVGDNGGRENENKSANDRRGDWRNNDRTESNNGWRSYEPNTHKGRDNDGKSSRTCRHFQQGRCFRESGCRFSHDLQLGGGSGRGSREASQQNHPKNDSTYAAQPEQDVEPPLHHKPSKYGGRFQYDRGSIKNWNTQVAASSAGSEVGGPSHSVGQEGDWRSRTDRNPDPKRAFNNRSVENPPAGNNSCQFYLGRCSNGDICTSSHDVAVAGDSEGLPDEEKLVFRGGEERRFSRRYIQSDASDVEGKGALEEDMDEGECIPHAQYEEIMANDDAVPPVEHKRGSDKKQDDRSIAANENLHNDEHQLHKQGYGDTVASGHYQPLDPEQPNNVADAQDLVPQQNDSEADTRMSEVGLQDSAEVRDYGHPLVEKSISGCAVIFNPGCLPEKITTPTDSQTLILEGPPDITENRVHDAVNQYGPIEDIVITHEQPDNVSDDEQDGEDASDASETDPPPLAVSVIRVEFQDMKDAAAASRSLNGTLDGALPVEVACTTPTWLRFRWPLPCRAAWVYYPTITRAKVMAEKLHESVIRGRKVTASFLRPDKRQKDLYAIKLEGLVADTKKEDLNDLVEDAKLITISELTYIEKPREILEQLEGLKIFVGIPEECLKVNAIAFACFDSEDKMLQALNMHGTKPKFLGKQPLVVERVWYAQYVLPTDIFKVISTEIEALHIRCEGRVNIQSCDLVGRHMIYLYSTPEEGSAFARANISLQAICRGSIVMDAGNQLEWDEYLYSTSSSKVIETLNSKGSFHIFPDALTRQVHVLGSEQEKGIVHIKKLLQKVRASQQEYPINRKTIRQMVNGGLSEIQTKFGANKLALDTLRSVLVIRGGGKDLIQRVRQIQERESSDETRTQSSRPDQVCVVCELQPGGRDSTVILACGHVYCVACLQHALIYATHDYTAPVKCIGRQSAGEGGNFTAPCDQPIAYITVRDLLPLLVEPEYLRISFTSFVLAHPDEYFFCPSLRCESVYRYGVPREMTRCPVCEAWICLFCGSYAHDGMDCEEAEEYRKALLS